MKIERLTMEQPDQLEKVLDGILTDITALKTSLDTTNTLATELKAVSNALYANQSGSYMKTSATLAIGTTVTLGSAACQYTASGVSCYKAAANTAFTATSHDVATGSKWGIYLVSIVAAGTITITCGAANEATGYNTEALAIAAMPSTPALSAVMGYITVQSTAGAIWNATTDALAGGTGGTPAAATNYYSAAVYTGFAAATSAAPTAVGTITTTT
jgi:hypothetical protein